MTTSPQPAPLTLLTAPDDKGLLPIVESAAGSCCGGDSCCIG